jgi:hypothetical protein
MRNVDLNHPEVASTKADKERELMLLQAAAHINIARAQRALYQAKVADAVADATARKEHSVRRYTFVVDYRQNMELPCTTKSSPAAHIF